MSLDKDTSVDPALLPIATFASYVLVVAPDGTIKKLPTPNCDCFPQPPIARITNNYIGATVNSEFTGSFHLTLDDNATPLIAGDTVTMRFTSRYTDPITSVVTDTYIAEATFSYNQSMTGAPLSQDGTTYTSRIRPYVAAGSNVFHGGSYTILKRPLAHNLHNTMGGIAAGFNKGAELVIEISATSQLRDGAKSTNTDNTTSLRVLREMVNIRPALSRVFSLPGVIPTNNPNASQDYVAVIATNDGYFTGANLNAMLPTNVPYEYIYTSASITNDTPASTITGVIPKTGGFYSYPSPSNDKLIPYWITLAGTGSNAFPNYKRHKLIFSPSTVKFPKLNFQTVTTGLYVKGMINTTQYRDVTGGGTTTLSGQTSANLTSSIATVYRNNSVSFPEYFAYIRSEVSALPGQDPTLGTVLQNNTPIGVGTTGTFTNSITTAGDGEYIYLVRAYDASNNLMAEVKSVILQSSY